MNARFDALAEYAAARELHETRANHLAIVERDIAAFWTEGQQDPSLPFRDADARTTRITRLMAERGAVSVVERQAYDRMTSAINTLVGVLPAGADRDEAVARLDAWPATRAGMLAIDCSEGEIAVAHRAMTTALCVLLDPLVQQGSPFTA